MPRDTNGQPLKVGEIDDLAAFFRGLIADLTASIATLTARRDILHDALDEIDAPPPIPHGHAVVEVHVGQGAFRPAHVTVRVGGTVRWIFDADGHSTTSVGTRTVAWDSGVLEKGATFEHAFGFPGTFTYYSSPHSEDNYDDPTSGMAGSVTVLPSLP